MKREIYDEDHEAFRDSVRQFLEREVVPHLDTYAANHGLDRDFWLAAGKQGFLGLEIPEEHGGSEAGDCAEAAERVAQKAATGWRI